MRWRPTKSERWKSSKRRTTKQKNQLAHLHTKHHLNDENVPPPPVPPTSSNRSPRARETGATEGPACQLDVLKDRAITYEQKYRNERKKSVRKEAAIKSLKNKVSSLSTDHQAAQERIQHLETRHKKLTKQNHALTMRARRAVAAKKLANNKVEEASAAVPTFNFKSEAGAITDASRSMVRDLVAKLDVPIASVNGAVNAVAAALGVTVEGSASSRSIRRIVGEAGVAAEVQLVDEIQKAEGMPCWCPFP